MSLPPRIHIGERPGSAPAEADATLKKATANFIITINLWLVLDVQAQLWHKQIQFQLLLVEL